MTLHLRAGNGRYAGPVVIGRAEKGKVAIVGLRAGAKLGRIRVLRGYAKPVRRLGEMWVDAKHTARARKGVPIGVRRFGRVRSRPTRDMVAGDPDLDGIPNPLDIDDDGDLVLDNLEPPAGLRAAQVTGFDTALNLMNVLPVGINETANANAGTSPAQADAILAQMGYLIISEVDGDTAELDCGLLRYCTLGGTGEVFGSPAPRPRFPECCDADGDGLGTIARNPSLPDSAGMFLHHGAKTAEIKTGDLMIERVTTGGVETSYPATLQYVFATIPALAYYSDTAPSPHSANVTYPLPYGQPGTPSGPAGPGNGFPVAVGQDGNVAVQLRLWRPQRLRIEGESGTGDWTDIGGLTYTVQAFSQAAPPPGATCPQDSLSQPSSGLTSPASPEQVPGRNQRGELIGGLTDTALDQPANSGNLLSFTVNVSRCLATRGITWEAGETITLNVSAIAGNGRDRTEQAFGLKLVQ